MTTMYSDHGINGLFNQCVPSRFSWYPQHIANY